MLLDTQPLQGWGVPRLATTQGRSQKTRPTLGFASRPPLGSKNLPQALPIFQLSVGSRLLGAIPDVLLAVVEAAEGDIAVDLDVSEP